MSHDGWLFISSGDGDNHGEGADGSRATMLRSGGMFRCRPDGSQLQEFARGFCNPYRDAAFDQQFNLFHLDDDQPGDDDNEPLFDGVRLIHVQDCADYGWRLQPGAVCCQADLARAVANGESPGKLPSMLKTGRGSPAGMLIYNGTRFPADFRGLLIYPDAERQTVRAYAVERAGSAVPRRLRY